MLSSAWAAIACGSVHRNRKPDAVFVQEGAQRYGRHCRVMFEDAMQADHRDIPRPDGLGNAHGLRQAAIDATGAEHLEAFDRNELQGGVIVRFWHVEDWAGVLRQLSGRQADLQSRRRRSSRRHMPTREIRTMTYAVTAVSGRLGREIAERLAATVGASAVIGLARTPAKASDLGIEVRRGDYDDQPQLETSLHGIGALVLVSGMAPPDERIGQHRNVIEAARAAGVRKIVYNSIQGPEEGTGFSPIVQSNRQTEADIPACGLDWAIGRNGIYIEPDIEYLDHYRAKGEIANSAGDGRCGYTTRSELAHAYAALLTRDDLNGRTADLNGTPITQGELASYLNATFGTDLAYRAMSPEAYVADRTAELGDFFGPVIGGIYDGIRRGAYDRPGDYAGVAGRPQIGWDDYFAILRSGGGGTAAPQR